MKTFSRRSFVKRITSGAAGAALLASCAGKLPGQRDVLFIAVDDLRDWVGYNKVFPMVKTPNIDRLAKKGMAFSNAYCAAPACCPSRSALFTGMSPAVTGVYENGQEWPESLRKSGMTLTSHFMKDGYWVAGSGKMYHGSPQYRHWHSFELFDFAKPKQHKERPGCMGTPLDIPDEEMPDYKRVSRAIEHINHQSVSPKFIGCGLVRPHVPFDVPRAYFDMYPVDSLPLPPHMDGDLDDLPEMARFIIAKREGRLDVSHRSILERGNWKYNIQAYLASITFADAQIGRLLDAWEASPSGKEGIIVLWGDHGWHLGEKEHWSKYTLWEEGTKTPFIMSVPGVTAPGSVCETPVSLLDIYPTLVSLCGLSRRYDLSGHDISPLLSNPALPWEIGAVTVHGRENAAVRTKKWRYIHYRDESKEMYDHENDPNEWHNLAGDPKYMPIINKLHGQLPHTYAPRLMTNRLGGKTRSYFDEDKFLAWKQKQKSCNE